MDRVATFAAVALGSNLGDRRAHLARALDGLATLLAHPRVSSIIETEPVGLPEFQPPFLNAVVVGETDLDPRTLLTRLHDLERQQGRERPYRWAPRTLDLDLILYGGSVIDEADIVVPHPRFRERLFVLEALAEVAPDCVDPVTGKTARELLEDLNRIRA